MINAWQVCVRLVSNNMQAQSKFNYTYKLDKSIPIGTMIYNEVEPVTSIFIIQDIVQTPEFQSKTVYLE